MLDGPSDRRRCQSLDAILQVHLPQAKTVFDRPLREEDEGGQDARLLEDGSIIIRVPDAGVDECLRWLQSFGPCAEALHPPKLRLKAKAALHELQGRYLGPPVLPEG